MRHRRKHPEAAEVRARVRRAFSQLRSQGFFARMNFWCCQTCACYDIEQKFKAAGVVPEEGNYVYFHQQDSERLDDSGEVMLAWGGDGNVVREVCESFGLKVEWDGSSTTRILVSLPETYREQSS